MQDSSEKGAGMRDQDPPFQTLYSYFKCHFYRSEKPNTRSKVVFWFGQIAKKLFHNLEFTQKNLTLGTPEKVCAW